MPFPLTHDIIPPPPPSSEQRSPREKQKRDQPRWRRGRPFDKLRTGPSTSSGQALHYAPFLLAQEGQAPQIMPKSRFPCQAGERLCVCWHFLYENNCGIHALNSFGDVRYRHLGVSLASPQDESFWEESHHPGFPGLWSSNRNPHSLGMANRFEHIL